MDIQKVSDSNRTGNVNSHDKRLPQEVEVDHQTGHCRLVCADGAGEDGDDFEGPVKHNLYSHENIETSQNEIPWGLFNAELRTSVSAMGTPSLKKRSRYFGFKHSRLHGCHVSKQERTF